MDNSRNYSKGNRSNRRITDSKGKKESLQYKTTQRSHSINQSKKILKNGSYDVTGELESEECFD